MAGERIRGRKKAHLELCTRGDVGFRKATTLFDCVGLVHDALPDLSIDEIDLGTTLCGKALRAPLVIAGMTGGTAAATAVNRDLAAVAEARGLAFGLGSQRAMLKNAKARKSYMVRSVAATTLVLGNIGLVQARSISSAELQDLVDQVGADALCVHLNPAMELVQPGGDRDFREGTATIQRLCAQMRVPVVAKETGCGLSPSVARRLFEAGVRRVDVSGAGGTSWVGVETLRARGAARGLGLELWDWGIPTAASVALCAPMGFEVIATGGIETGSDLARAIALGATACGIARPILRAHASGGRKAVLAFCDQVLASLRAIMLLTGSKTIGDLRRAPRVVTGTLRDWLDQIG